MRLKIRRDERLKHVGERICFVGGVAFVEKCACSSSVTAMHLKKMGRIAYQLELVLVYPSVYSIEDMMNCICRVNYNGGSAGKMQDETIKGSGKPKQGVYSQ